jgi:uncharacterized membrane protein
MRVKNIYRHKPVALTEKDNPELADVIEQNITTISAFRERLEKERSLQDRIADALTDFSGSMPFFYVHLVWFGFWILYNMDKKRAFDPFPFGLLTLIVSLEAIFLSTFVLVSQNRAGAVSDKRADLDLQINLLSEYEITRLIRLVDGIADHLGVAEGSEAGIDELKKDVAPDKVLDEIAHREKDRKNRN